MAFILSWLGATVQHFLSVSRSLACTNIPSFPAAPHQYWTGRGRKAGTGSYVLGINVETRKSGVRLQLGIIFLGLGKFEQSWEPLQLREEEEEEWGGL